MRLINPKTGAEHVQFPTRAARRKSVGGIIAILESVLAAERHNIEKIPENFQCGPNYENAEISIDLLDEAIELLRDAY